MVDWISLAVPLAYLGVLIGSLATFSSLYRKRKARKATSLEPWFPTHLQRDIYLSLLHLDPSASSSQEKKAPAIPESVLKAALLRRATEDIRRIIALRTQKQALAMLLQRGSVGDDLWQCFLRAEKEIEDEVKDVASEANAYVPNWGSVIFQSANEMMNNSVFRERMQSHVATLGEERQWWNKKKANAQDELMKQLDVEDKSSAKEKGNLFSTSLAPETVSLATGSGPVSGAAQAQPSTASAAGSDDDAVLVEADDQAVNVGGRSNPSTGKKKKKGKK